MHKLMENIGVFIKECTLLLRGNLMVELLPKKEKNNGGRVFFFFDKNGGRVGTYINAIYYL